MCLGVLGALMLTRVLTDMLYDVTPLDPISFLSAAVVLAATAAVASLYPAARAARINPSEVLQNE
jgi:ABC-type lipoprotein release transport system permease subunit